MISHIFPHETMEMALNLLAKAYRGRLVPRQPRAIKRTTRTELRGETIVGVA